ncbi:MAG: hypothetical protein NTX24_05230 [Candidatus Pacearchaeota archaeon]|nr:hypothetical protein [Candidatus Pacearchaeota archaeon]
MKRGLIKFVCLVLGLIVLLFSLNSIAHSEDAITSKVVTGEVTALTNASITIGNAGPVVIIYNPKEGRTYRNTFILLNYSVLDPDGVSSVWYNVNGVNISLGNSSNNYTYFNTTEGNKTLYLYANDSTGLITNSSVNFYVNNTKLIIIYETFRGGYRGNSNDFDSYTENELENFSNMTLENTNYGKIIWNEKINLSEDINSSDKITTLDYNVIIANQSIFVNTTELPNLNKNAALWFYNLTFYNPIVLMDGVACPVDICFNKTYSNGILSIVVASFFNFSLEENPNVSINAPENLAIYLRGDNVTTKINWSVVARAEGYMIYYSDNLTEILQLNSSSTRSPEVVLNGSDNNTYNDTNANNSIRRFYRVAAYINEGLIRNISVVNETVGKYTITILSDGIQNEGTFSYPINQTINISNMIPSSPNPGSYIYTYSNESGWVYNMWTGSYWDTAYGFETFEPTYGYWTWGFQSEVNMTNIGKILLGKANRTILSGGMSKEGTFGWESITTGEDISNLIPSPPNPGSYIYTYLGGSYGGWVYNMWTGSYWDTAYGFETFEPTYGYWTWGFNEETNINYTRNPY